MTIIEKDFKIEHSKDYFTLYFLKTKKELKEDSENSYKIGGYYVHLKNALFGVQNWRADKKYPFKEMAKYLSSSIVKLVMADKKLKEYSSILKSSILQLKNKIYEEHMV